MKILSKFHTLTFALLPAFSLAACGDNSSLTSDISAAAITQPVLGTRTAAFVIQDGLQFRDLNGDGELNPYEDWRRTATARAADLASRMTLREKAATMMHGTLPAIGPLGKYGVSSQGYDLPALESQLTDQPLTSYLTRLSVSPTIMAAQNNEAQAVAENTRLGIPLTISSDPRNHFQYSVGTSVVSSGYSQWPEPLGFAALRDPKRLQRFSEIARQEYRATGIHQALSPQADLATEPQWARGTATFGSNPDLARDMVKTYVAGFQGGEDGVEPDGVMAVVKHWVGYGASPNGWDGHNYYGRVAKLDNAAFDSHIKPFTGAFDAKVSGVMPAYSIVDGVTLDGEPIEAVGAGFSKQLLTDTLRGDYGFDGIILSDWSITEDCPDETCKFPTQPGPPVLGSPWGVDALTRQDRIVKGVTAGLDQFGGAHETDLLVEAVEKDLIDESRINESVQRILLPKFKMGLFENPYVEAQLTETAVAPEAIVAESLTAQAEAQVLLKADGGLQPLAPGSAVYLIGVDPDVARTYGLTVVSEPEVADAAIIRLTTPFEVLHPYHFFGSRMHEGRLDYRAGDTQFETLKNLKGKTRIIASVYLNRPAILTEVAPLTDVLMGNFGVSDAALLDVVTGKIMPKGRLPFELPSSMAAVAKQNPALPDDSTDPLFPFGAGIIGPQN